MWTSIHPRWQDTDIHLLPRNPKCLWHLAASVVLTWQGRMCYVKMMSLFSFIFSSSTIERCSAMCMIWPIVCQFFSNLCDTSLSMHVNIYKPVLVLSSNTTHAFFLPPGFHGKSVGENRRRFTYSHITHGLVWVFFFFTSALNFYILASHVCLISW